MNNLKLKNKKIFLSLASLFVGAILPLAFAPFDYYLIAEISLALLLIIWINASSAGHAFWYGWLFGFAFFGCGVYWIYISIHHFGNAPIILTLLILGLLIAVLALYPALQGYVLKRFYPQNSWYKFLLVFPASWVLLEWLRGWLFSGFPWLFLGYGHVDAPLRGWATIFGVYGLSFFIAQTAGAVVCLFLYRKKKKLVRLLLLLLATVWLAGFLLTKISWTQKIGESVSVSLIQGNIPLEQKWNEKKLFPILDSYVFLTKQNFSSKIIVWPEAAIPIYPENIQPYLNSLSKIAKEHNMTILSGIPFFDKESGNYYNGILALGVSEGHYYKRHLVPFGEYLPLRFMLGWLHNYLTIPMSGFANGSKNQPDLLVDKTIIAPFICYEIAYADLVLAYLPRAGLIITVCDDSWFGESIAAAQHLEIARIRCLEVGRYQLLSTNTGITAIIDANGKVISQAPIFKQASITKEIEILSGATPWVSYGKYFWALLVLLLLGTVFAEMRRSNSASS